MTVDQHGMIRDVNAASLDLFKAEMLDLIGRYIGELAIGSGRDGEVHPLVAFIEGGDGNYRRVFRPDHQQNDQHEESGATDPQSYAVVVTQIAIGNMNQ